MRASWMSVAVGFLSLASCGPVDARPEDAVSQETQALTEGAPLSVHD